MAVGRAKPRRSLQLRQTPAAGSVAGAIGGADVSLLDLVDHVLNQGVLLSADVVFGLADVDLVYLRLQALLSSVDRVFGSATSPRRSGPRRRRTR